MQAYFRIYATDYSVSDRIFPVRIDSAAKNYLIFWGILIIL